MIVDMNNKYKLVKLKNDNLSRVYVLKDFGNVKTGDVGEYIEHKHNLSHNGDCWVGGEARVQ